MVNRGYRSILDGLFPAYCALCGLPSQRVLPLCMPCQQELPRNNHCCARCALPLPAPPPGVKEDRNRLCGRCLVRPPPFQRVRSPWLYGEYMAFLIQRWKFAGQTRLTALLADLWLEALDEAPAVDLLIPVPLHWRRLLGRGFNQSALLSRQLRHASPAIRQAGLDLRTVQRCRATAPQTGMDARQRTLNLRSAFTVRQPCDNLRVAVVDDVLTTGATAAALSTALLEAGAAHVEIWCLARTPAPE